MLPAKTMVSCRNAPKSKDGHMPQNTAMTQYRALRFVYLALAALFFPDLCFAQLSDQGSVLAKVQAWAEMPTEQRQMFSESDFASQPISKEQAAEITTILWQDYVSKLRPERKKEWDAKSIRLDKLTMKFEYRVFGDKPADGRSLFISMHGGGGAPPQVNEQQWRNQIRLYEPAEGVYLAPRAPTDTWNLWHQSHIDDFFQRIIQDATLFADVNPNKVYIMGYSAGGDGVYQLAPRMADRLAAAAMMAGHPNNASPLGLRNIGFTLHMGGKDAAYKRNQIAAQWKDKLAKLQTQDPQGYKHEVVIHPQFGHWMNRKDAVAVPWMAEFKRNPRPDKVVWKQSSVTHPSLYWLEVDTENQKKGSELVVTRKGQEFEVQTAKGLQAFSLRLNDQIVDLDRPITVRVGDATIQKKLNRTAANIYRSINSRGDRELIFSAGINIPTAEKQ